MELRQLRHFLAVVEHGNFHRAADYLHITQQALSASIGKLEHGLGTTLLQRGPNGVVVTASGARLVDRARLIWTEAQRITQEVREFEDARTGSVRLGIGAFFAEKLIPAALASYLRAHPGVDVAVVEATSRELFNLLSRGEIDFSLSTPIPGVQASFDLEHETLFVLPSAILMRRDHALAGRTEVSLPDLVGWPWVVSHAFSGQQAQLQNAFRSAGLPEPDRLFKTDSFSVVRYLVTQEDYLMMSAVTPPELAVFPPSAVASIEIPELAGETKAILAWRRGSAMLPAAARLKAHIRRAYRTIANPDQARQLTVVASKQNMLDR